MRIVGGNERQPVAAGQAGEPAGQAGVFRAVMLLQLDEDVARPEGVAQAGDGPVGGERVPGQDRRRGRPARRARRRTSPRSRPTSPPTRAR